MQATETKADKDRFMESLIDGDIRETKAEQVHSLCVDSLPGDISENLYGYTNMQNVINTTRTGFFTYTFKQRVNYISQICNKPVPNTPFKNLILIQFNFFFNLRQKIDRYKS